MSTYKFGENMNKIPGRMRKSILGYLNHGHKMGSFLTAVFSNDLFGAISRADDENVALLKEYVVWVWNYAPHGSHGSPEKVKKWIEEAKK